MEIIATRKKEEKIAHVLCGNLLMALCSLVLGFLFASSKNLSSTQIIIIYVIFIGFAVLATTLGIINIIFCKRVNKQPQNAILLNEDKLVLFTTEEITINIKDIVEIKGRRYLKQYDLVPYIDNSGVLYIKTQNKKYKLENIQNIQKVKKQLQEMVNV